jgi:hypothetical protein
MVPKLSRHVIWQQNRTSIIPGSWNGSRLFITTSVVLFKNPTELIIETDFFDFKLTLFPTYFLCPPSLHLNWPLGRPVVDTLSLGGHHQLVLEVGAVLLPRGSKGTQTVTGWCDYFPLKGGGGCLRTVSEVERNVSCVLDWLIHVLVCGWRFLRRSYRTDNILC